MSPSTECTCRSIPFDGGRVTKDVVIVVDVRRSHSFLCRRTKIIINDVTVSKIIGIALSFGFGRSTRERGIFWHSFGIFGLIQRYLRSKRSLGQFEPTLESFWFGSNRLDDISRRCGCGDRRLTRYGEVRRVICTLITKVNRIRHKQRIGDCNL